MTFVFVLFRLLRPAIHAVPQQQSLMYPSPLPDAIGGDRQSHRAEAHAAKVLGWINEQQDLTLVEIATRLAGEGHVFAPATIWRLLHRHNYTVKKRPLTPVSRNVTM